MRVLYSSPNPTVSVVGGPTPAPIAVDSEVVVILAALLCALICVVGLALVARCAMLRRSTGPAKPPSVKGLNKKALRLLPKSNFEPASAAFGRLMECPICLERFSEGEEIRILPGCGHGFHAGCVDQWLGTRSSCPSCRRVLVVAPVRCMKCAACSATKTEGEMKVTEDRFLP